MRFLKTSDPLLKLVLLLKAPAFQKRDSKKKKNNTYNIEQNYLCRQLQKQTFTLMFKHLFFYHHTHVFFGGGVVFWHRPLHKLRGVAT